MPCYFELNPIPMTIGTTPVVWLDASSLSTLFTDSAGTTPVTADGDPIGMWYDRSGNARHVTQASGINKPVYKAGIQNGYGIVRSINPQVLVSASTFEAATSLSGNPNFTTFIVYGKTEKAKGGCFGWGNTSNSLGACGIWDDNNTFYSYAYAGSNNYNTTTFSQSSLCLRSYTKTAGAINTTSASYRNGLFDSGTGSSSGTPNITAGYGLAIGSWAAQTGNSNFSGDIAEVIIYNSVLTNANRKLVENYLMNKWKTQNIITNSLLLYLDGFYKNSYSGSGSTWTDISGSGNTGTLVASPTYSASTNGGIFTFNGSTQYATIPYTATINGATAFSVNMWVRSTSISTWQMLFTTSNAAATTGWNMQIYLSKLTLGGYPSSGFTQATTTLQSNTWYNLCITYVNGLARYYVNSVADGTGTTTPFDASVSTTLNIGARNYATDLRFVGNISNVSFYNRVLSPDEIIQNYNALYGRFGTTPVSLTPLQVSTTPVLWLDGSSITTLFTDNAGATQVTADGDPVGMWKDRSGNNNHATQSNGTKKPTYKTNIKNGNSVVRFSQGSATILQFANYLLMGTSDYTIFCVVQRTSSNTWNYIFGNHDTGLQGVEFYCGNNNTLSTYIAGGAITNNTTISINTFYAFTTTRSGGSSATQYKNNVSLGSGTVSNSIPSLVWGIGNANTYTNEGLTGDIAEIIVFDIALSASDRQTIESYLNTKWAIY